MTFDQTIFIVADHGLAIIYFLESQVVSRLLEANKKVVLLTQDALVEQVRERFKQPGFIVEGLRYDQCDRYARSYKARRQWWLNFLRRVEHPIR